MSPALLVLSVLLGASCTNSTTGVPSENGPARVVVLVIDALHADHLGSYDPRPNRRIDLTPNLDAIAAEGRRFSHAISNNTWTLPSTASLMTGLLQEHHGVTRREGVVPPSADLLAERFQEAGWTTASFVQMTFASSLYGFDQGFDETSSYGFGGGPSRAEMAGEVETWMQEHAENRYFLYLHFRRPHGVYNAPMDVRASVTPSCPLAGTQRGAELEASQDFAWMELSEDERKHIRHMYRANLATVDRTLGPILELARADGTLLVVTSDHGEGLGEHGFYGHGPSVFRENLHIPLIVRGAGVEIGVDDGVTSTVDLRPTLVELCELVEPLETARDGHSLVARLQGAPAPVDPPPVYFSGRYGSGPDPASGAIVRGWSVFVDASGAPHAFDLSSDPIEAKDRGAGDQAPDDIREQLRAIGDRQARYAHLGAVPMGAAPKLTDADEADLRALGYAGD